MEGVTTREFTKARYDYMVQHDIPTLVDGLCAHLLQDSSADPTTSAGDFLRGRSHGNYTGGCAIVGRNAGGGWLRIISPALKVLGSVDKASIPTGLTSSATGSTSGNGAETEGAITNFGRVVASTPTVRRGVYLVTSAASRGDDAAAAGSTVLKYDAKGAVMATIVVPKRVTTIAVDRTKGYLYVALAHGGITVYQANGSSLFDLHVPMAAALCPIPDPAGSSTAAGGTMWMLTSKSLEKRQLTSGHLDLVIRLPEAADVPSSLVVTQQYVYCSAANPDGTASFVGCYDFAGRSVPVVGMGTSCHLDADPQRGGVWQLPRNASTPTLTLLNETRLSRLFAVDATAVAGLSKQAGGSPGPSAGGAPSQYNCCLDVASSLLWICTVDAKGEVSLMAFDPIRHVVTGRLCGADAGLPEAAPGSLQIIAL